MTYTQVLKQLEEYGTAQNRTIYTNHGCDIPMFGVSMAHLKQVLKSIKNDTELGSKLFMSDYMDAIYLSQWVCDPTLLTTKQIEDRIRYSNFYMIIENAIPNLIVKNKELTILYLRRWLEHKEPRFRQAAYALYSAYISIEKNSLLDINDITNILNYIQHNIHTMENRVKYTMNQFVISVGAYIPKLHEKAMHVAIDIGKVDVFMGQTSYKVPFAPTYLAKIKNMNRIGKKRNL